MVDMAIRYLLSWWYGAGWFWILKGAVRQVGNIRAAFSVGILLKTLFAPWKQIQSVASFQNFLQTAVDNMISRFIGATVRTGMLLVAAAAITLTMAGGVIIFLAWPLVPLLVIALPILTITGLGT